MKQILTAINANSFYLKIIQSTRTYFLNSQSKEQLNRRLHNFYKFLQPLFLRNGPRRKQDMDVIDRLNFLYSNVDLGRVVDVGCFDGYFSQKLREKGCEVVGLILWN